ncbi:MAG: hypothetical protein HY318_13405 [Armatimonadetes bacterium]|nr:hypothetical protein [Armatimonadota bacterium]
MATKAMIPPSYRADMRWAREHSAELHGQYEDLWVAIVDQTVVAAGLHLGRVEQRAARKTGRKPEEIYVEFVESASAIYG